MEQQQTHEVQVERVVDTTTMLDDGTMAMKATVREHVAPAQSVSAPAHVGADYELAPNAAPPSRVSRSLRAETSPSGTTRAASDASLIVPQRQRTASLTPSLAASLPANYSSMTAPRSADLENSGVVSEERIAKLRAKWGIPASDVLVREAASLTRQDYIFPNHLVFVSHSHRTNICIPFVEVEQMVRKRHRIHLITHDKTHRLRGSLTQNSTTYGILLAVWQRVKGDSTIDLDTIRACDKKLQKAIRKGERRGSLTGSDGTYSEMDSDDDTHNIGDSDSEDEPTLECHTSSSATATTITAPSETHTQAEAVQEPKWTIPLEPQSAAPPGFATLLHPPADAQNVNRVSPLTISASLERCWSILYASDSSYVQRSMAKNHLYDISIGSWVPDSEPGVMTRVVKYTKPMQSAFVKGDALVEQTQKVVLLSQPTKKLYVWQESRMQSVPYADSFVIHAFYEAMENGDKTSISNTAWVVWVKSPPRLLRGKIERGSVAGVEESFKSLMTDVESALLTEAQSTVAVASPPASVPLPSAAKATAGSAPSSAPVPAAIPAMMPTPGVAMAMPGTAMTMPGAMLGTPGMVGMPGAMMGAPMPATGGLHIDEKYVYAVVAVLLFSVIANIILAACR